MLVSHKMHVLVHATSILVLRTFDMGAPALFVFFTQNRVNVFAAPPTIAAERVVFDDALNKFRRQQTQPDRLQHVAHEFFPGFFVVLNPADDRFEHFDFR